MTRKNQKQIAVLVLSVLVLCLIGVAGQTMRRRNRAEAFLYDATALRLRVATLSQVQELAAQYGGHVEPSTCSPRGCGYFFSFDNGWLRRLRLAPRTWFSCTLGVADGVLDYRGVVLTSGNTSA